MNLKKWSLLSRLRRVINKVKVLLSLDMNRWRLASMIGNGSTSTTHASSRRHQLSFNDRPGLRACTEDLTDSQEYYSSSGLRRTISYPSEDDIDKRAEMFIENFRRQLQIERQVSSELRCLHGLNSFKSISP